MAFLGRPVSIRPSFLANYHVKSPSFIVTHHVFYNCHVGHHVNSEKEICTFKMFTIRFYVDISIPILTIFSTILPASKRLQFVKFSTVNFRNFTVVIANSLCVEISSHFFIVKLYWYNKSETIRHFFLFNIDIHVGIVSNTGTILG